MNLIHIVIIKSKGADGVCEKMKIQCKTFYSTKLHNRHIENTLKCAVINRKLDLKEKKNELFKKIRTFSVCSRVSYFI